MANYTMQNKDNYCEEDFLNDIYDCLSEKLNYTLELADICLWEWDLNTDMVEFGPYAVNLLGLNKDQTTIPMSYIINNILHKDSRSNLIKALELAKKDGVLSNNSYSLDHPDGSTKWVKINGKLFYDNQNNQTYVKGIIKDITNEHLREAKLGEDLNFVETLLEIIPEPLFYKNNQGKYKYFNKSFLEYLGMSYDEIYNKTVYDIAPESLAKIYDDSDKSLMSSKGTQQYETEVKYADNSIRLVDFRKAVHLNSEGEVDGILGIMYDITKRKQEADKLHHLYMMKETFLKLNNNITLYSDRSDFFADVLINFQKLFGNSQQSSILEIDDQGIARAVASKGYIEEEISKFQIEVEKTFIYIKNNGQLDSACIINDLHTYIHNIVPTSNSAVANKLIQSSLEIPIIIDFSVKFIISIDSLKNHAFNDNDLLVGDYIRTQFQILYRVFTLYQRTLYMARYDGLTALMNRRYFDEKLMETMVLAEKNHETFFIALYDLDNLKKINDTYGHNAGDLYIGLFCKYLKDNFSDEECIGRLGGDEFISIIHNTNRKAIVKKIELIRTMFMQEKIKTDSGSFKGSFSYGLQQYKSKNQSLKDLIQSADKEMYEYKKTMKNS